jgi:mono/diheme cytochrome c family protein
LNKPLKNLNYFGRILGVAALCAFGASAPVRAAEPGPAGQDHFKLLEEYCSKCHNATDWAGGLAYDVLTPDTIGSESKTWEHTVRKLRGRLMPPPGEKQPDQQAVDGFVNWMEGRLDAHAGEHSDPGHVGLYRINRTQYALAVESLLRVKVNPAELLPKETKSEGFDNVANVLRVSPTFIDQYINAARQVSVMAVGDANARPLSRTYRASPSRQAFHQEGFPLGTRGGMAVEHWFPADAEYEFNLRVPVGGGYGMGLAEQRLVFLIDGRKVFEQVVGGEKDARAVDQLQAPANAAIAARFQKIRVPVTAGPHRLLVTFQETSFAESEAGLFPFTPGGGSDGFARVTALDVVGPYNPTGVSDTPSRRKIFICRPASAAEEEPCARRIVARLATEAFRRPVTDEDLVAPLAFYAEGRKQGSFDTGIQSAVMAILASPKFLYRLQEVPPDAKPGQVYALSDLELATRLAFFLWSQGPDDELLQIAAAGKLKEEAVLDQQIERMLKDPRAGTLVTNFAAQWLNIEGLADVDPDPAIYPTFDEDLRRAYRTELELFAGEILGKDRNVTELISSDITFVNERLALQYGIPNIRGDQFRRIRLQDSHRRGLLGKGAVLMLTSYGNRTAPVIRGAYILERITGTPPAAPPPGVEALKDNTPGGKQLTVRQRLEIHREKPSCNACHGVMDPLGFALENFDAIGSWRTVDRLASEPIDASATTPAGQHFAGPDDVRAALLERPEQFVQTLTEKLMTYGLGRLVEHEDMPRVRAIVRDARSQDYRFSALVRGVVHSDAFRKARVASLEEPKPSAVPAATLSKAESNRE